MAGNPYSLDWDVLHRGLDARDQNAQAAARNKLAQESGDREQTRLGLEVAMQPGRLKAQQQASEAASEEANARKRGLLAGLIQAQKLDDPSTPLELRTEMWGKIKAHPAFKGAGFDDPGYGHLLSDPNVGPGIVMGMHRGYRDPLTTRGLEAKAGEDESKARLNDAQAAAARVKPTDVLKLGEGDVAYRPDPTGGYHEVARGGAKNPSGYEADPTRSGRLRPVAGGPADVISQEQAARIALISGGVQDMPKIREIFLGAPKFGVSESPLGPNTDPVAYIQSATGIGKVGEGQRMMQSAMDGVLRTLTGAASTKEEVANELRKYMPQAADTAKTRADKLDLFERNLRNIAELTAKGMTASDVVEILRNPKQLTDRAPTAAPNPTATRYRNKEGVEIEWNGKEWARVN